jgi:predicted RNA-binding protein with RPS1 domain
MPRKAAEPIADPLEQAEDAPAIAETDVERRLEEELAALEGSAEVIPEADAPPQEDQPEEEPQPPPRRRRTPRRAAEEAAPPTPEEPEAAEKAPPTAHRRAAPRGARVITIDEQRSVETPDDKARSDLIDLVESMKSGKLLTDTLQGVECNPETPDVIMAVLYHGDFKVIIPVAEAIAPPRDFRDRNHGDVLNYQLTKRLGSEFDYIVKGVDADNRIAAASRMEAMAVKRKMYYNGARSALKEGATTEARVSCVIRTGAFVEIFGVETFIPLRELSYQRWMDATQHYQPGQRVLVKILSVERKSADDITVEASVKQVGENPYEKALRRFTVGNQYVGSVSVVDTTGVFVSLDGGIDCLCSFPRRGRPPRGSRVTVRIRGINYEANRIWGTITHMTTH